MNKSDVLKNLQEQKEQLEYQIRLVKSDIVEGLKRNHFYDYFSLISHTKSALKWLAAKRTGFINGEKIDNRRRYEEKLSYKALNNAVSKVVGYEVEVEEIIDWNFTQAYEYCFTFSGRKLRLQVPVVERVTMDSFENYGESAFMYNLYECSGITLTRLASSFDKEDIQNKMNELL